MHAGVNCVCVMYVAPPTHVGAWSMAVLLEQPFDNNNILIMIITTTIRQ